MRAITIEKKGGAEVLKLNEASIREPDDNEVVIDVVYCGCNWADTQVRSGIYPHPITYPMIIGFEISGKVIQTGKQVTRAAVGDRVCAILSNGGGYAEQVVASENDIMQIPDDLPLDVAAAFPIQALTAYHMLHTVYQIQPGDNLICHAIGGGVGLYVTQLAKHAGANVIGTLGTKGKEERALEYGADRIVNYNNEDFVKAALEFTDNKGIDIAIDSLGAKTLDRTFGVMRNLGHVINIGEAEGEPFKNIRERILPKSLTFTRFHLQHVEPASPLWEKGREYVIRGIINRWLRVPIVEKFPLKQASEMHRRLESRQVSGKLLLATQE